MTTSALIDMKKTINANIIRHTKTSNQCMHNALHTPDIETFLHYSIYDVSLDHNNDKFKIIMDDMKEIN